MGSTLLFCIAKEAKPVVHKLFTHYPFLLVQSRDCALEKSSFITSLNEGQTFETDFINATPADCQKWTLEKAKNASFLYDWVLFIADARTAQDGTILFQMHLDIAQKEREWREDVGDEEPWEETQGPWYERMVPRVEGDWHSWRIQPGDARDLVRSMCVDEEEWVFPTYFGRKEELTGEDGVFDAARASRVVAGKDSLKPKA